MAAWLPRTARRLGWEPTAVGRSARSALRHPGPERDTMVQSLKAAGAAIAAWALTGWRLEAPMALLAPWTALVLVASTVYRSVHSGVQQFAVIVVGTLWASAALAATGNSTLGAMALTLPPLVPIGNYRRLGDQGIYGATTALFVITYGASTAGAVGHRLLETLIGAVVGVAANAFVLPPVHLRSVRENLHALVHHSGELLASVVERAVAEFGRIDVLVNNAAYQMAQPKGIGSISTEQFDRVVRTNLHGMFRLCKFSLPHIPAGGSIISSTTR